MHEKARYEEILALKGKMRECDVTYRELVKKMGIGLNSLNDRLNGYYSMDVGEMAEICKILKMKQKNIPKYFFV